MDMCRSLSSLAGHQYTARHNLIFDAFRINALLVAIKLNIVSSISTQVTDFLSFDFVSFTKSSVFR